MKQDMPQKRRRPVLVVTEQDLLHALDRIEELSGCLEGTAEEATLVDLIFKIEVFEAKLFWRGTRAKKVG